MAVAETTPPARGSTLQAWQVYSMAAIYLAIGLVIGYVLRASRTPPAPAVLRSAAASSRPVQGSPHSANPQTANPQTLDQMKQIADQHLAPLLEKVKSDPRNPALLMQIGSIYHASHRFKEAADFYGRAVQADPSNPTARTKLAISLFRAGDADGAVTQLNLVLRDNPGDANALFNLGMIRWQGKRDAAGALAAWQRLLKLNPQLSDDRKAEVEQLIAGVQPATGKTKSGPRSEEQ